MGYLALHEHCSEPRQMCVTSKSLGASVNCRTMAIAWRGEKPRSGKVCEKKFIL